MSRQMLHDMAMLEQAARTCRAEYQPLRYMPTMATASDGVCLTVTAAPAPDDSMESILNSDSSASSTGNNADIKGGKKSRNRHLARMMRSNLASEAAAVRMFGVQSKLGGKRPDLEFFKVRADLVYPQSETALFFSSWLPPNKGITSHNIPAPHCASLLLALLHVCTDTSTTPTTSKVEAPDHLPKTPRRACMLGT